MELSIKVWGVHKKIFINIYCAPPNWGARKSLHPLWRFLYFLVDFSGGAHFPVGRNPHSSHQGVATIVEVALVGVSSIERLEIVNGGAREFSQLLSNWAGWRATDLAVLPVDERVDVRFRHFFVEASRDERFGQGHLHAIVTATFAWGIWPPRTFFATTVLWHYHLPLYLHYNSLHTDKHFHTPCEYIIHSCSSTFLHSIQFTRI